MWRNSRKFMRSRLNESDINRIVKKIINEDVDREKMMEIVDDVVNRLKEHGMKYYLELNKLNFQYPTEKYKRVPRIDRDSFELPPNVKVTKSIFAGRD